ncbi:MAG: choice-of-anchor Q domain-containing protein [Dokdonella sp.]
MVLPVDTIVSEPQLAALALYSGSTRTHALGSTSPAIDHGNTLGAGTGSPTTDQRGADYARVVGASADIGAFEYGAGPDRIFGDGFEICAGRFEIVCRLTSDRYTRGLSIEARIDCSVWYCEPG